MVAAGIGLVKLINNNIRRMKQWYEINPELLEMERIAMSRTFPHFTLDKLDDGRLCWIGQIESLINKRKYEVMCIYGKNFPLQIMGPSILVCPILPDVDDIRNEVMFMPCIPHILTRSYFQPRY